MYESKNFSKENKRKLKILPGAYGGIPLTPSELAEQCELLQLRATDPYPQASALVSNTTILTVSESPSADVTVEATKAENLIELDLSSSEEDLNLNNVFSP